VADVAVGGLESAAEQRGSSRVRFPAFDGFRALAAISVLITHVAVATGANRRDALGDYLGRLDSGVAVFFLISGFLLYRPFVAARMNGERPGSTRTFLTRRALRIYPAYWLALTTIIVVSDKGLHDVESAVRWYGLVHIYSKAHVFGPLVQSWTLATEVAFYLFLPCYALLMRRWRASIRQELLGVGVLFAIGIGFRLWTLSLHSQYDGVYGTWLPAWLDHFALGMLLAVVSVHVVRMGGRAPAKLDHRWAPAVCWALAAVSFWVVCTRLGLPREAVNYRAWQDMAIHVLYGVTAFFLLLPGVFGPQDEGAIRRLLRNRAVQAVGLISYGIYLWHDFWIDEYREWTDARLLQGSFPVTLAVVLALALVTATVSYVVVERPLLRWAHRPSNA
jgi:peptidoglycan/LPS O-acetylase OafA/YrhL